MIAWALPVVLVAALLSSESRPVLLIGESGQGKSTLSRLLVERDLCYITDEITYCDESQAHWFGVSKPLSYKASNRLFPLESLGYGPFSTPDKGDIFYWNPEEIPIDLPGRANDNPLVVFLEFDEGHETSTVEPECATGAADSASSARAIRLRLKSRGGVVISRLPSWRSGDRGGPRSRRRATS